MVESITGTTVGLNRRGSRSLDGPAQIATAANVPLTHVEALASCGGAKWPELTAA
jgi:hypothetical protein